MFRELVKVHRGVSSRWKENENHSNCHFSYCKVRRSELLLILFIPDNDPNNFSQLSGISIMSVPAEVYVYGIQIALLIPLMTIVVVIINKVFIPVFYHNHIANCYEVSVNPARQHCTHFCQLVY